MSEKSSNLNTLKEIKIGDHVCSIHEDQEQSISFAVDFLKFGLENWEKCLYIGDVEEMSGRFEKIGGKNNNIKTGQLKLVSAQITTAEKLQLISENYESAIMEGYRCFRVAQEMILCEELLEYETKLNDFYPKIPALGICQYVVKVFGSQESFEKDLKPSGPSGEELLLKAVKAHPKVYIGGMVCENPYYFSPTEKNFEKELKAYLGLLMDKTTMKREKTVCEIRSQEILKERTKKLEDSRNAIFNMLKDMDESYKKLQKAYSELETLDRMKDEFISNVSHELKTPLISIKGYGELLYDEKQGPLLDEQRKSLEAIIRNADRLTRLINSILFMSRMQSGKIEFHFEPVDLDDAIGISVCDFKSAIDKKQIAFEKVIPKVSMVRGEKDRLIEVISNLLDNAIKFTPLNGKISIKAWDEAENVHLTVSDNGIGIPDEILPKLFMRFYQVDASASRKYGGTGLGLYITKTIIDILKGKIWIESGAGKGTTVHVLLPIAREVGPLN
ncbi:MAG: ATP-binding protein [Candidatus Methanoperedens sp.]|nr:ATP-binding protein [Candidatus Methanoperedens sp.]